MTSAHTIGDYLLDRIVELGVNEIFGVPGDYNLRFLDSIVANDSLRWIGAANELNAGYAADGYARLRGLGVLVTTFGVGEVSAFNAQAGSFAESVPVLHIVGAPAKHLQAAGRNMHHTLADGRFDHFIRMAEEISVVVEDIQVATAAEQIDRLLRRIVFERRPGYLLLAADVAATAFPAPSAPLGRIEPISTETAEQAFEQALREVLPGRKASVLADVHVHRVGLQERTQQLLERTGLPFATLTWGKSLLDESLPGALGVYSGASTPEAVRNTIEKADALITLGVLFGDTTTSGYRMDLPESGRIDLHRDYATVDGQWFATLPLERSLEILESVLLDLGTEPMPVERIVAPKVESAHDSDAPLTQDQAFEQLWDALDSSNVILADQGSSFFGASSYNLPAGALFVGQPQWGSIGYTLPATLGVGLADPSRRPVLIIGDGAAQMTIQELGTLARQDVPAVVLLINNDGYSVERAIHGPEEIYNDIQPYNWSKALEFFGADPAKSLTLRASTGREMAEAIREAQEHPKHLVFIEVVTERMDVPAALRAVTDHL